MDPAEARDIWHLLETVHAVTYFAPTCRRAHEDLGFRGFWMGYFGTRAAPLGAVGPAVVGAAFYNFAPDRVARAVPDAWSFVTPEAAIEGRAAAAATALRDAVAGLDTPPEPIAEDLIGRLDQCVESADPAGRPLFAANADLDPFDNPVADLWQLATSLREHRGDGHNACLVAEGIGACEAHVLFAAAEGLVADGALTDRGRRLRGHVESRTDELAAAPYAAIGAERRQRLIDALVPLAGSVAEAGWLRFPNPMGLPPVV